MQAMSTFLIVVPEGGMLFEAVGIADILARANLLRAQESSRPAYRVIIATTQAHHVVHGQSGLNLLANERLADLDPCLERDTIMVTGKGASDDESALVADWLRRAAPMARRVVSVCGGALLLAAAGVLDGRRATTHWRLLDTLHTRYPAVKVERGPIYVEDGPVWTSAGASSGFDLTLALVEDDHGHALARNVAQDLVIFLHRPGGQAQFGRAILKLARNPGAIRDLQSWIAANLAGDLSVESLAERAAMSPRNFTRVFARETGIPPARYVEEVRLDAARERLEQGAESIEHVAAVTGFGSALNLRRVFEKKLQLTPGQYRERFRCRHLA
jgi:transcriptional regulator GlxA family with amidase domain